MPSSISGFGKRSRLASALSPASLSVMFVALCCEKFEQRLPLGYLFLESMSGC